MNTQYPWLDKDWISHTQLMLDSFRHCLGYELVSRWNSCEFQAKYLFQAPLVVVSHDTQMDPILNYGNQAALDLWEMNLKDLLVTPSSKTAEPVHRDEREQFLTEPRVAALAVNAGGDRGPLTVPIRFFLPLSMML